MGLVSVSFPVSRTHSKWIHYKLKYFSCMSELANLDFFSRATLLLARSIFLFISFHLFYIFRWAHVFSVQHCMPNTFIFNFFFSSSSTVSYRTLTVECSLATILEKFVCVFFLALCIIYFQHSPFEICFTF